MTNYDKAILAACRRQWARWETIVGAVLREHKDAQHVDIERAVDRLTAEGKLQKRDDPDFVDRTKWRKA